jgi:deoxyribodipyrimidine photo-lyase
MTTNFAPPTRAAALERLTAFVPAAGATYASRRNFDSGPGQRAHVSMLSPYVRHRLISEQEIVAAVLARHSQSAGEKFVQEVCWRTYWKGWLEMRPAAWRQYCADLDKVSERLAIDRNLAAHVAAAEAGRTGIECFDAWAQELTATGYLHNHTRMWFASIWVYTLNLPWQLGADFFMRHLLDGDPASNTLSWRWVCGLQTAGKTYLARADNIETYTGGQFAPQGQLATVAVPLDERVDFGRPVKPSPAATAPAGRALLVLTEDDLTPEQWPIEKASVVGVAGLRTASAYPGVSPSVVDFKQRALADALARAQAYFFCDVVALPAALQSDAGGAAAHLQAMAVSKRADALVSMGCPVGPTADAVQPIFAALVRDGWPVHSLRRRWDEQFWPHATHGFFKLKEKIPAILEVLEIDPQARLPI